MQGEMFIVATLSAKEVCVHFEMRSAGVKMIQISLRRFFNDMQSKKNNKILAIDKGIFMISRTDLILKFSSCEKKQHNAQFYSNMSAAA